MRPQETCPPLSKKIFYLDLKNSRHGKTLAENLGELGASIEGFLSKDINYVVTDRPEWKKYTPQRGDILGTPLSHVSTPSSSCPSSIRCGINYDLPYMVDSPAADTLKSCALSRGQALLQRATTLKPQGKGTTDVLEVCRQWGVKVLHVDVVISWLEKLKKMCIIQEGSKHMVNGKTTGDKAKPIITVLDAPFIKVEDLKGVYRPFYKTMSSWPEINFATPAGLCPFTASKVSKPRHHNAHRDACLQPIIKHSFRVRKTSKENLTKTKAQLEKLRYCEICRSSFLNLERHLRAESHARFLSTAANYKDLHQIMTSLQQPSSYLSITETKHPQRKLECRKEPTKQEESNIWKSQQDCPKTVPGHDPSVSECTTEQPVARSNSSTRPLQLVFKQTSPEEYLVSFKNAGIRNSSGLEGQVAHKESVDGSEPGKISQVSHSDSSCVKSAKVENVSASCVTPAKPSIFPCLETVADSATNATESSDLFPILHFATQVPLQGQDCTCQSHEEQTELYELPSDNSWDWDSGLQHFIDQRLLQLQQEAHPGIPIPVLQNKCTEPLNLSRDMHDLNQTDTMEGSPNDTGYWSLGAKT